MKPSEIKIAVAALALMALVAYYISANQHRLGKPGLIIEAGALTNVHGAKVADQRVAIPEKVPGYASELLPVSDLEINVLPQDTTLGRRLYKSADGFTAQVSAVLMKTDRTSIHKPHLCLGGQGWAILKTETITVPMLLPHPYELQAQILTLKGAQRVNENKTIPISGLFLYWYVADGQLTANHKEQMWWLARDLVQKGTLQRWAYVSTFGVCSPGQEGVLLQRLKRLISEVVPEFQIPPGSRPAGLAAENLPDRRELDKSILNPAPNLSAAAN